MQRVLTAVLAPHTHTH